MPHRSLRFDLESLLSESAAFRRLAAALARDPHERDDLVQDAWLAALEQPPRWSGDERETQSWFARVLRRRWSRGRRAEELRRVHEPRAARAEAQELETQTDERLALQQRVLQALSELDEPGRSALRLSHLEGRSAREIAAIQGASEEAVRQRISRSLAKLRQRLSREDVHGLGLMALPLGLESGVAAGAKGVLLMSMQAKVLTVCACAVLLFLAWMIGGQLFSGASEHVAALPEPLEAATRQAEPAPPPAPGSRTELVASETSKRAIDREHDLHGIVLDGDANPVSGAEVKAWLSPNSGLLYGSGTDGDNPPLLAGETRTDERGEFALRLERGRAYELEASAPGFATHRMLERCAGERVRVTLRAPAILLGVIMHHPDGRPIAHARVHGSMREDPRLGRFETRTGEDGQYRAEGLDPGEWSVRVYPGSGMAPESATCAALPGTETTLHIAVMEAGVLRGRVVDAESGQPIEGASVSAPFGLHVDLLTDARGEFLIEGVKTPEQGGDGKTKLRVSAPGHASLPAILNPVSASDRSAPVEIRLPGEKRVVGKVVDARGQPVADVRVALSYNRYSSPIAATRTDDAGHFELGQLGDFQALNLVLYGPGFVSQGLSLGRERLRPAIADVGTLTLQPGMRLEGRVVDEEGRPLADTLVHLRRGNESEAFPVQRRARSDDLGRFAFADVGPGRHQLAAGWPGNPSMPTRLIVIEEHKPPEFVEFLLAHNGSIAGRVQDSTGAPVKRAQVALRPEGDLEELRHRFPREYERSLSTDADGSFCFLGLEAPSYRLFVFPQDADPPADVPALASPRVLPELRPGAKLDIRLNEGAWLEGRVVATSGTLTAGADARYRSPELHVLDEESGVELRKLTVDSEGRFRILLDRTRFCTIVAGWWKSSGANGGRSGFDQEHALRVEHLTPGGEPIELRLP